MLAALITILFVMVAVLFVANLIVRSKRKARRYGLFRFSDGKQIRSLDPIQLLLSLEADKELLLYRHPEQARKGNKEAIRICTTAIQNCFGVVPYTDPKLPGLTITEMLDLLDAFCIYCELQKKSTNTLETSEVSSESISSESIEQTTQCLSGSGSIAVAQ